MNHPIKSNSNGFLNTAIEGLGVIVRNHFLIMPQRVGKVQLSLFFFVGRHADDNGGADDEDPGQTCCCWSDTCYALKILVEVGRHQSVVKRPQ